MDYRKSFKEWIWERFLDWRGDTINGPTAFARYLGVKQQILSDWMAGKYKPKSQEHVRKLAEKYPEIYEVLGIEKFSNEYALYTAVPQPYRDRLRSAVNEIIATLTDRDIDPESLEGQHIAREAFARYGFDVNSIEIKPDPPDNDSR